MLSFFRKSKDKAKSEDPDKETSSPPSLKNLESDEGELVVDLYHDKNDLFVRAAVAGIRPENLEISIEDDIIAISGERKEPKEENIEYLSRECYFGPFSRRIISPFEIDGSRAKATMKDGILVIRIPKIEKSRVKLEVKDTP